MRHQGIYRERERGTRRGAKRDQGRRTAREAPQERHTHSEKGIEKVDTHTSAEETHLGYCQTDQCHNQQVDKQQIERRMRQAESANQLDFESAALDQQHHVQPHVAATERVCQK